MGQKSASDFINSFIDVQQHLTGLISVPKQTVSITVWILHNYEWLNCLGIGIPVNILFCFTNLSCQQAWFCSPVCFRRAARLQRQTVCSKQSPEEPPLSHSAATAKQHHSFTTKSHKWKNKQQQILQINIWYNCAATITASILMQVHRFFFRIRILTISTLKNRHALTQVKSKHLCGERTPPYSATGHLQFLWRIPAPAPVKSWCPHLDWGPPAWHHYCPAVPPRWAMPC